MGFWKPSRKKRSPTLIGTSAAVDGGWLSFMGLFWMTAPVAWIYAIPVERFVDSISAAWANVALLSLVSLWRVLLMTRVIQVTTKAPFFIALVWVLFAACIEVLVVFFFGGGFSRALIAGMGGMRNSPEEEVILGAMGTEFGSAFWLAPVTFLLALFWRPKRLLVPLPRPRPEAMPWRTVLGGNRGFAPTGAGEQCRRRTVADVRTNP